MADEITININATVVNGQFREQFRPGSKKYDQAAPYSAAGTVALTTDTTTIPTDAVTAQLGWCFFANLSTSMPALIGPTSSALFVTLPTESACVVPLTSDTSIMAQTTANSAVVQYLLLAA